MQQTDENGIATIQNPEGQSDKTSYSAEEYKNLQAFSTKASQERIELAKKLVSKDPKEILAIDDIKLQNKVIKELYTYDNLDELKVMLPELFEEKKEDGENNEDDRFAKLEKEQRLMRFKLEKEALASELEKVKLGSPTLEKAIPNFEERVKEELKYISSELPLQERVKRAVKMVSSGTDVSIEALLALQGKSFQQPPSNKKPEELLDAQNSLRKALWLKTKTV